MVCTELIYIMRVSLATSELHATGEASTKFEIFQSWFGTFFSLIDFLQISCVFKM